MLRFIHCARGLIQSSALAGVAAVTLTLGPAPACASPEQLQTLLLRNNCTACHLIDKRKYGPHMKEVAAKYAGPAHAAATLSTKIKQGGGGVWGEDVMPPQPLVRDADLRARVDLILALKP